MSINEQIKVKLNTLSHKPFRFSPINIAAVVRLLSGGVLGRVCWVSRIRARFTHTSLQQSNAHSVAGSYIMAFHGADIQDGGR
ncbi:hypothetical protein K0M31_018565 [Melipona bicolor]|uniref:Uncharacterized protein n=1 Tax=Melipona bicolor TaxID=60889 RepID=A0AA40KRR8_9HYME|nr:hypothetical protein K0M31_018565 [Melipona bicolor]